MKMLRSKMLLLLLAVLTFGGCEKSEELPCREILSKHRIPMGYLYEDDYQKKFIIEHELYFFILSDKDTVMVGDYEFENMNVGECYYLPKIKK